jgi:hypothetical protein
MEWHGEKPNKDLSTHASSIHHKITVKTKGPQERGTEYGSEGKGYTIIGLNHWQRIVCLGIIMKHAYNAIQVKHSE